MDLKLAFFLNFASLCRELDSSKYGPPPMATHWFVREAVILVCYRTHDAGRNISYILKLRYKAKEVDFTPAD